ncbi:DUF488 domain-containing protein [Kribbella qitaiheensis]|uniref:DUF488 domain-containing protein n=1 Tax=Kribbella qitaiheensis TaxID=1544730 RepID=UPI001FEC5671|nr:DUF488 domain-containing protein [Kribbella qitaiheensis]
MVTIGVYDCDPDSFLQALRDADVRLLLDIRQRRGVRGSEYAWANSRRLQSALADAGIAYEHHPELAPTTELREVQYVEDDRQGVGKRTRRELAAEFTRRYTTEILDRADLTPIVSALTSSGTAALLLRRTRPRGLPPLADRSATSRAAPRHDRAPAPVVTHSGGPHRQHSPSTVRRRISRLRGPGRLTVGGLVSAGGPRQLGRGDRRLPRSGS